jgi:shikimate dehydrogenase
MKKNSKASLNQGRGDFSRPTRGAEASPTRYSHASRLPASGRGISGMMRIDPNTRLYGVVGNPLTHTLSPALHNAAFAALGVNALYLAFETRDIEGALKGLRALGLKGLSVTRPYKSVVIPWLDKVEELTRQIGAVNTIVNQDGRLIGYNTDADGALQALERRLELKGITALILGAGGAARAIGFILKKSGAHLTIVNRSRERGEALARALDCTFRPWREAAGIPADLIIQTTPVGMHPFDDQSPLPAEAFNKGVTVMDIIYNPPETRLLRLAKERGCATINGLEMFIAQGAEQFRRWTGLEPPLRVMKEAVEKLLRNR